ncbi:hypothetical protein ONR57_04285 [Hoyosella sp. YIM 151337]|uniref:poly(ethylene terephthalate) hydrolase family protein n=1 Tax=Hoyosella sp. YIM 151337 TaxID=2992742 RepID=UPI00223640FF|nr:hypothetical protein [Hoyosella sp. YIM 151337]MCW4352519.1 hypothetical protein [Hoyosella sp. YIM 151337]
MAPNPKKLVARLARRGPHRVLRGDLAMAGMPGLVFTPESGFGLPAIAFGHTWMTSPARYTGLFKHLASWGFVVAAPATERGFVPSAGRLAADLNAALEICTNVRLGPGEISVHPSKLAFAGHGFGAGAAVLAAAARTEHPAKAVAALYPAPISPSAEKAAPKLTCPGLILAAEAKSLTSNARPLADAWGGDAVFRLAEKSTVAGMLEGRSVMHWLGIGRGNRKTQRITRTVLTGYLLNQVAGDKTYSLFSDAAAEIKGTLAVDISEPPVEDEFSAMFAPPRELLPGELAGTGAEVSGSLEHRAGGLLQRR